MGELISNDSRSIIAKEADAQLKNFIADRTRTTCKKRLKSLPLSPIYNHRMSCLMWIRIPC